MNLESVRKYCLTLPHTTEVIQWVDHLLFKVGGKMFAVMSLEPRGNVLSFKATPDQFFELQELDGIVPAPYMARAQWLALERFDALRDDELRDLLATSHRIIFEKLPKRTQAALIAGKSAAPPKQTPKKNPAINKSAKKAPKKSPKKAAKTAHKKSTPKKRTRR
jgi:predicted DNA-binding protein (MmcQ/YjbR family)